MSVSIADVAEAQLPQIAALERRCFSMPWTEAMLRSQTTPGHMFLAAAEKDAVLGYVGLTYVLEEGYVSNVAVAPERRRRGIADALLAALERRAREKELSFLTLEVRAGNAPAIALYQKHGFRAVGRRKNYYEKPREDAILMTLELKNASTASPDGRGTGTGVQHPV